MKQKKYGVLFLTLLLFCILLCQAADTKLPAAGAAEGGWRLSAHLQERSAALFQAGRELRPILSEGEIRRGQEVPGRILMAELAGLLLLLIRWHPKIHRIQRRRVSCRREKLMHYIQCTDLP